MILPPFFGFIYRREKKELEQILFSYLTMDVMTYTPPTEKINLSYLVADVMCYTLRTPQINLSYLTTDILCYSKIAYNDLNQISYLVCDVLTYELPPSAPGPIEYILSREKDSLGIFSWTPPYNGKSSITDYAIEYTVDNGFTWTPYYDGINSTTGLSIPITNNIPYSIKIAAVNAIGTGLFTQSSTIIPSGGIDNDCDLLFFADMNQSDRNQITEYSCNTKTIETVTEGVYYTNDGGAGSWFYTGEIDYDWNSNIYETYPHMRITSLSSDTWSLNDNFTISIWIKPLSINDNLYKTIISAYSQEEYINTNSWKLYQYNNNIYFSINESIIVSATNLSLATNTYTHIAVCRSQNYISLFINGIEKNEAYYNSNITIDSNHMIIGASHDPYYYLESFTGRGFVTQGFKGYIDDVIVSKSCFYRKNFVPIKKSTIIDCTNC